MFILTRYTQYTMVPAEFSKSLAQIKEYHNLHSTQFADFKGWYF